MPVEPAQTPADNTPEPKKVELPIEGEVVDVKGHEGVTAKRQGNVIHLEFDAPNANDTNKTIEKPSTDNIIPFPQKNSTPNQIDTPTGDVDSSPSSDILPPSAPDVPDQPAETPAPNNETPTPALPQQTKSPLKKPTPPLQTNTGLPNQGDNKPPTTPQQPLKTPGPIASDNAPPEQTDEPGSRQSDEQTENAPAQQTTNDTNRPLNQPASTEGQQLSPEDQRTAGQDMKKDSMLQRAQKAGKAMANAPKAALNKTKNLASKAGALGKGAMNAFKNPKKTAQNLGRGLADAGKGGLKKMGEGAKQGLKNKARNIAESLRTTKSKKRRLLKEIEKVSREISQLQGDLGKLKTSPALLLLKFFFPGLYNKIAGISEIKGEAGQKAKVAAMDAQVIALKAAKAALQAARLAAAVLDAIIDTVRLIAGTGATIIIPIILILISPLIIIVLSPIYFLVGCNFSRAIKQLVSQLDKILEPLEKTLGKEKQKLGLMEKRKSMRRQVENMESEEVQQQQQQQQQQTQPAKAAGQQPAATPPTPAKPETTEEPEQTEAPLQQAA